MQSPRTVRTCHSVGNHSLTRGWYEFQWTQKVAETVKDPLGFLATQEGPRAMVPFLKIFAPFSPARSFLMLVPKIRKLIFCHVKVTKWYCCPHHVSFLEVFRLESRGRHNNLGVLFLELLPEALYQLWREAFSFLCSHVNWSSNLKSVSMKDTAQTRVVREHLPSPQCPTVSSACLSLPAKKSHLH